MEEVYAKAEIFSHFGYGESNRELMLLDLQGVGNRLYDPEIATSTLIDDNDNETFFCTGNLSVNANDNFISLLQFDSSNRYCSMLGMENFGR